MVESPKDYAFYRACGWSKISEESILVYGGYDYGGQGVNICSKWAFSDYSVQIQQLNSRLITGEGFLNSPGVIINENLYAIQNV